MKKIARTQKKDKKLVKLYERYSQFKKISELVPKKSLPPLTLDQQIESINPYYVRNEFVKYG